MLKTIRLTMAQALVRYLCAQKIQIDGKPSPLFHGVFAIFGHGNVAGIGEALHGAKQTLPTYRAHNEQAMAHAAIAFAKAKQRRGIMACTSSIGPGATNMLTAAALAHANRLPVLFLPGDVFANRMPDPVLQQIESFAEPGCSVNDCFRPVSRYFDRITRPEQIIHSLPVAIHTLLDPENCGPVTLALCQDVQSEAFDFPISFFADTVHSIERRPPDSEQLERVAESLRAARKPLIVAGGGVLYGQASAALQAFAEKFQIPVAETQAGKGSLPWSHQQSVGSIGVTGSVAANALAEQADVVIAIGTRLQDFTTASRTLFENSVVVQINVGRFDACKHRAIPLVCDAKLGLQALLGKLQSWLCEPTWAETARQYRENWLAYCEKVTAINGAEPSASGLPSDAQVVGAVKRASDVDDTVVCAAGGLPGELHKLWPAEGPGSYHVEYGFSCMGYEIAGGLGAKMARPQSDVFVLVGDGSYMMMNSEIATSVMLGLKLIVVVLDNRGFACINRLQQATGGEGFNNLLSDCLSAEEGPPVLDFAAHAAAMGAEAEHVNSLLDLPKALLRAKAASKTYVISIDTDPYVTSEGGQWWDVAVPEVSQSDAVHLAYATYCKGKQKQPY